MNISATILASLLSFVVFLTCSAVVSLWELDLDFVLPGDVLYAAAFRPHDGAVIALRDGHLHAHLRLLLERGRQPGNSSAADKHRLLRKITSLTCECE